MVKAKGIVQVWWEISPKDFWPLVTVAPIIWENSERSECRIWEEREKWFFF